MTLIPEGNIDLHIERTVTALDIAHTPAQTMKLESASAAMMAYHKEMDNYTEFMEYWRLYIMSSRKTTELIKAELEANNLRVTDTNYGFTEMQWSRRLKELSVTQDELDAYFDELVANGWQPSKRGLFRHASGTRIDRFEYAVEQLKRGARILRDEFHHTLDEIMQMAKEA